MTMQAGDSIIIVIVHENKNALVLVLHLRDIAVQGDLIFFV